MDICLIPARSRSKRIKNKNILSFFGNPMISYSIKTAIKSKLFDKILVTTDSKKIAKISKNFGAEIPFLRPKKLSNNHATDKSVIEHFLSFSKKQGLKIRFLCYLYAVNPLLKISTLKKCKKLIIKSKNAKVITIGKYPQPIQHAFKKNNLSSNVYFREKQNENKRTQDLSVYYHDAAQCYWFDLRKIRNIKNLNASTGAVLLKNNEYLDVDTHEDLANLKNIYKYNLHKL